MQADYLRNRGYSIGYWWLVCQNGDSYQIRGTEYNSAANLGVKVSGNANDYTAPILFDVRYDELATPAAIATARRLWNSVGIFDRPVPHRALDYTTCCGDRLIAQINAGEFDNPTTTPPIGDDDMYPQAFEVVTFTQRPGAYLVGPGGPVHLDGPGRDRHVANGVRQRRSSNADVLASYERLARGIVVT
jgi:hypothetical protein